MNISTIIFLCCLATCTISVDLTATQKYAPHLDAGEEKAAGLCARCSAWWHKQTHSSTVMVGDQTMPRSQLAELINHLRNIELESNMRFIAISHLAHTRKMVDETTGDLKKEIRDF